jgi:hypothetical protein
VASNPHRLVTAEATGSNSGPTAVVGGPGVIADDVADPEDSLSPPNELLGIVVAELDFLGRAGENGVVSGALADSSKPGVASDGRPSLPQPTTKVAINATPATRSQVCPTVIR